MNYYWAIFVLYLALHFKEMYFFMYFIFKVHLKVLPLHFCFLNVAALPSQMR